jgi:hypothetical protein
MELSVLISVLSVISVIIGFVIQYYAVLNKLQERMKAVEIKSDLFWKVVETEIPKLLQEAWFVTSPSAILS